MTMNRAPNGYLTITIPHQRVPGTKRVWFLSMVLEDWRKPTGKHQASGRGLASTGISLWWKYTREVGGILLLARASDSLLSQNEWTGSSHCKFLTTYEASRGIADKRRKLSAKAQWATIIHYETERTFFR